MAKTQIIGDVRVFSWHAKKCPHKDDRSYLKCQCSKWLQWQQDGKTIQKSAKTRSFAGVKAAAERQTRILRGEVIAAAAPKPGKSLTIEQAVKDWLKFREKNGLGNSKSNLMGRRLSEWADAEGLGYLHELTSERVMTFRNSLPYKTHTSGSLKIHWSVMCSFFGWAHGMKLIAENPVPNTKLHPQFRIKYKAPEVIVPTAQQVEQALASAKDDLHRLFLLTMRWSGMAIRDTATLSRTQLTDGNLIKSNRSKTKERFRVRVPQWVADQLLKLPGDYFFWDGLCSAHSITHRWEMQIRPALKSVGEKMSPHKFRHFFISEQLAAGMPVDAVSLMVGTSPQEIRKTYQHWIREAEDRQDALQAEVWKKQGLDSNGNEKSNH
jgi:integrase